MSKPNDWFATLMYNQPSSFDEVIANGVTPDNTEIKSEDYYRNLPEVKETFSKDGKFDETAFDNFYTGALHSYNDFSNEDWTNRLIEGLAKDPLDWMQPLKTDVKDVSVTVGNGYNPQRRSKGIAGINSVGDPVFSVREIAQDNYVRDEEGNILDWTPNQKHGLIKSIFLPSAALAQYDEDGWHTEFGRKVRHRKGDLKTDDNGDFYYQLLGDKESYGRELLHWSDILTVDGTTLNKFDPFDSDGLTKSIGSTVMKTALQIAPLLIPGVGPVYGTIGAFANLASVMPTFAKAVNSIITNDSDNNIGKNLTLLENWFGRFGETKSDKGKESFWNIENIGNILSSSARQLYEQKAVMNVARALTSSEALRNSSLGKILSLGYLAVTSSDQAYSEFKQAGASDRAAGIGMLAVTAAFYGLLDNEYFRNQFFKGTFMDESEAPSVIKGWLEENGVQGHFKDIVSENATQKENLALFNSIVEWFKKIYSKGSTKYPWIGKAMDPTLGPKVRWNTAKRIINRAANEGVEETMEEISSDAVKALFVGMDALGIPITEDDTNKIDFGFTPEEIIKRYAATFIGGALGGATFEGIDIYNKHFGPKFVELGDKTTNQQMNYLIATGHAQEMRDRAKVLYDKSLLGNKNLSATETRTITDANDKEVTIFAQGTDDNNQNLYNYNMVINQINYLEDAMHRNGIYFMLNGIGNIESPIPTENIEYKKAYDEQQAKMKEQNIESDQEYTYYNKENALTQVIEKYKADTTYVNDIMNLVNQIVYVQGKLDQLHDKEDSQQVKDLTKLKKQLVEQYTDLITGKNNDIYAHQTIFTTQSFINEPLLGGIKTGNSQIDELFGSQYWMNSVQGYVKSRYNKDWKDLNESERELLEREYQEHKKETGIDQLIWASKMHYGLLENSKDSIFKLIETLKDKGLDSYYDHSTLAANTTEFEEYEQNIKDLFESESDFRELNAERQKYIDEFDDTPEELNTDPRYNEILTDLSNLQNTINNLQSDIQAFHFKYGSESEALLNESLTDKGWTDFYEDIRTNIRTINSLLSFLRELPEYERVAENIRPEDDPQYDPDMQEIALEFTNNFKAKYQDVFMTEEDARNKVQEAYQNILNSLKSYYTHLANDNIVSESDAVLKTVVHNLINPILDNLNKGDIADYIDDAFESIESEGLSDFTSTLVDSIFDYLKALNNGEFDEAFSLYESIISEVSDFFANNDINQNPETIIDTLLASITQGQNFKKFLDEIQALKEGLITFSINDLIRGFNLNVGDDTLRLIDYLEGEEKRFHTFADKNSYYIENASYLNAIKQIPSLLTLLGSAINFTYSGVNSVLNKYREIAGKDALPDELPENVKSIINSDIDYLYQKASILLGLSELNSIAKKEFHRNSELKFKTDFIKNIFFAKDAEDSLYKKISTFLNLEDGDLENLWGDNDYKDVSIDNFSKFNKAFIEFSEKLYDRAKVIVGDDDEKLGETIASWLPDDAWKMKAGEITDSKETSMTPYTTIIYLATILSARPTSFYKTLKAIEKSNEFVPIIGQEVNLQIAIATIENSTVFNKIVDHLKDLAENNNLDGDKKTYVTYKTALSNFMFIAGGLGTGKTQVIIRYIDKFVNDWYKDDIEVVYAAPHDTQLNTLGDVTGSKNLITIEDIMTKIYPDRNKLKSTDSYYHTNQLDTNDVKVITKADSIYKTDAKKKVMVIDEATFISERDLQLLNAWAKANNVIIIGVGDRKQNGININGETSGIEDCLYITGPELTESIRMKNIAKAVNVRTLATPIRKTLNFWIDDPAAKSSELEAIADTYIKDGIELIYYDTNDVFVGDKFISTSDFNEYVEKFKRLSANKHEDGKFRVAIITSSENLGKYKDTGCTIISSEKVQGGEFDYVIIDKNFTRDNNRKLDLLRDLYTLIGRASEGSAIIGNNDLKNTLNIHNNKADSSIKDTPVSFADDADIIRKWKMDALDGVEDITLSEKSEPESTGSETNNKINVEYEIVQTLGSDQDEGEAADVETKSDETSYEEILKTELEKNKTKFDAKAKSIKGKYGYDRNAFIKYLDSNKFLKDESSNTKSLLSLIGDSENDKVIFRNLVDYISSGIMFNFREITKTQLDQLKSTVGINDEIAEALAETFELPNRKYISRTVGNKSIIYLDIKVSGKSYLLPIAILNRVIKDGEIIIDKNTPLFTQVTRSKELTSSEQLPLDYVLTHGRRFGKVRIYAMPKSSAYDNKKFTIGSTTDDTRSIDANESFYKNNLGKTFIVWSESKLVTEADLEEIFQYDKDEDGHKIYSIKVKDILKDRINQQNDIVYTLSNGAQIRLIQVSRQISTGFAYDVANILRFTSGSITFDKLTSRQKTYIGNKNNPYEAMGFLRGVYGRFSLDLSSSADPKEQKRIIAENKWKIKRDYKLFSSDSQKYFLNAVYNGFLNQKDEHPSWYSGFTTNLIKSIYKTPKKSKSTESFTQMGLRIDFRKVLTEDEKQALKGLTGEDLYNATHLSYFVKYFVDSKNEGYLNVYQFTRESKNRGRLNDEPLTSIQAKGIDNPIEALINIINDLPDNIKAKKSSPLQSLLQHNEVVISLLQEAKSGSSTYYNEPDDYDYLVMPFNHITNLDFNVIDREIRNNDEFKNGIYVNDRGGRYKVGHNDKYDSNDTPWRESDIVDSSNIPLMANIAGILGSTFELNNDVEFKEIVKPKEIEREIISVNNTDGNVLIEENNEWYKLSNPIFIPEVNANLIKVSKVDQIGLLDNGNEVEIANPNILTQFKIFIGEDPDILEFKNKLLNLQASEDRFTVSEEEIDELIDKSKYNSEYKEIIINEINNRLPFGNISLNDIGELVFSTDRNKTLLNKLKSKGINIKSIISEGKSDPDNEGRYIIRYIDSEDNEHNGVIRPDSTGNYFTSLTILDENGKVVDYRKLIANNINRLTNNWDRLHEFIGETYPFMLGNTSEQTAHNVIAVIFDNKMFGEDTVIHTSNFVNDLMVNVFSDDETMLDILYSFDSLLANPNHEIKC